MIARSFTNEGGEPVDICVGDAPRGNVGFSMAGPNSRGDWTVTPMEAAELHSALGEFLQSQKAAG